MIAASGEARSLAEGELREIMLFAPLSAIRTKLFPGWNSWLHLPDPLPVVPHRPQRGQISRVENVFGRGQESPFFGVVPRIAGADRDELKHTWVAVTIDHAPCAAIPDQLRRVEIVNVAHRRLPEVAAIKIKVPIEIKIFVPAQAAELLRFLSQVPLHFRQRLGWVDHGEPAAFFHLLDLLEYLDQFFRAVIHQARLAETQVT